MPMTLPFSSILNFCFWPQNSSSLSRKSLFVSRTSSASLESLILPQEMSWMTHSGAPCGTSMPFVCSHLQSFVALVSHLLQPNAIFTLNSLPPRRPSFAMSPTVWTVTKTSKASNSSQPISNSPLAQHLHLLQLQRFPPMPSCPIILKRTTQQMQTAQTFIRSLPMPNIMNGSMPEPAATFWACAEAEESVLRPSSSTARWAWSASRVSARCWATASSCA
mmetsp:Transcript_12984/g.40515  ORF Transcript_12984/g.40515 Transcript_12984/m.40515 type:complete len:220 (+) Transcript_12984:1012-1671(+)